MTRDIVYEKELAAHIDRMVSVLETLKDQGHLSELDQLSVERAFQVLVEALIGLSRYVLEKKFARTVTRSREAVDELRRRKCLTDQEHARLMKMIGFRNVLVHDYLNVDPAVVQALVDKGEYRSVTDMRDKLLDLLSQ